MTAAALTSDACERASRHSTGAGLIGLEYGPPGEVHAFGSTLLVLWYDPHDAVPRIRNAERVVLVSQRSRRIQGPRTVEWVDLRRAWTLSTLRALRATGAREALVHSLEGASFGAVWLALAAGAHRIQFTHLAGASLRVNRLGALVLVAWTALRRTAVHDVRVARLLRSCLGSRLVAPLSSVREARCGLATLIRHATPKTHPREDLSGTGHARAGSPPRIVHYIGSLGAGGAERQLAVLTTRLVAHGNEVQVLTAKHLEGDLGHFQGQIEHAGVAVRCVANGWSRAHTARWIEQASADPTQAARRAISSHPAVSAIAPLAYRLALAPPDVFHAWLDDANIVGASAALLAGVPRIIASTHSLSPAHYPHLTKRWHRPGYRLLAHAPDVRLIANSRAGAADYAQWAGFGLDHFTVIPNGVPVERFQPLTPEQRRARRAELGIAPDAFLVVGILRCSMEKRPLDFVRAIGGARARGAPVRGIHIGSGPDAAATHALADELGLGDAIAFLGALPDPERYLSIADVALLPSEFEGCPNVPLEAQALGVPAIVTRGGGAPEAVREGETGFVCGVGDTDAMGALIAELARDPARTRTLGERGRTWVAEHFSMDQMVSATLALYGLPSPQR